MSIKDFNPSDGRSKHLFASGSGLRSTGAKEAGTTRDGFAIQVPAINMPKGGGALKNIDEKFRVNPANGTASFSVPLPFSKTRSDFAPAISLGYDSGSGNGPFGLGWSLDLPSIQRKTSRRLPLYEDGTESDIFMFTGVEDLVPVLREDKSGNWTVFEFTAPSGEKVRRYRPRIEKDFYRIERITPPGSHTFYWIVTSPNNIVTVYGKSVSARLADPSNNDRVFKWLPELSFDDKGNCMEFEYLPEDRVNVSAALHEQNRLNGLAPFANIYLKRVKYGNSTPYAPDVSLAYNPSQPLNPGYLFETVFDLGDHDAENPSPLVQQNWPARNDAFSAYHACFEIRTYRLCRRVLFFHYFKELNDGEATSPYFVRSLDIQYRYFNNPAATPADLRNAETDYIISLQQSGYKKNNGLPVKKSFPSIDFDYQEKSWDTTVRTVSPSDLENAPAGITGNYQWLDLWNEGISGILSEQGNEWFYKSNLGNGNFSPAQPVIPKPSLTGLTAGNLQLQDLEGDGRKFIVSLSGSGKGYFELSDDQEWEPFRSFSYVPDINLRDPNTRFFDLDGDGRPEIVISGENIFTWYAGKGMQGYDDPKTAPKPFDEEQGPAMVFNDPTESIFLADMSGDGLTDIVRVRNGDICYWPNIGYGQFAAKVNMDFSPVFDRPETFDPALLRLVDISGTGATDILYLGAGECRAWINLSGNAWSEAENVNSFPSTVRADKVFAVDFTGNGTASLVWSSALPAHGNAPLRYMDLMGGKKPFLLNGYRNNFGKEVTWEYKSSTAFYLADKRNGTPWITRLPFPVHCVSKISINDRAAGTYFANSYTYHHGYYDHPEKEFRGFGRVEQTDTEDFENFSLSGSNNIVEKDLHQAPVKTITWYHTGAFIRGSSIIHRYEKEYNRGSYEFDLPQSPLPEGMSPVEYREAVRACKGIVLRQEVYAADGDVNQDNPFSVTVRNYQVKMLQPAMSGKYAVFLSLESETADFYYERNMNDPRVTHSLTLETDDFGNILKAAKVAYGRKTADSSLPADIQQEQAKRHITFTFNSFSNYFDEAGSYRVPLTSETKLYELTGINPVNGKAFKTEELLNDFSGAAELGFEIVPDNLTPQKRLMDDRQTIYLANDLVTSLPLGQIDTQGLIAQSYRLALTPSLLNFLTGNKITAPMLMSAQYAQPDGINWWIPSGRDIYLKPAEAVSDAQKRFYLPVKIKDAGGKEMQLVYDDYSLLLVQTEDAMHNKMTVDTVDYRVLEPAKIQDANDNFSEVVVDELGMVIAASVYGKESDGTHGDSPLAAYHIVVPANTGEVINNPQKFLQQATTFFYYDLFAWINSSLPVCFTSVVRETHGSELSQGQNSRVFINLSYSNGMGQVMQMKTQAEPGIALEWKNGALTEVDTTPALRWTSSGRTILNNKGNPVKQYEPFFSATFEFESEAQLVGIGFTPVFYYDAPGRNIRIDRPNGTFSAVKFDAWQQQTWDENDTVLQSQWYADRGSPNPLSPEPTDPEIRAAWLAAKHADTPFQSHFDAMGRVFYVVADNGTDGKYSSMSILDIADNLLASVDARNNTVMQYRYDMAGRKIYNNSMDSGEHWIFPGVMNEPLYAWDSRGHQYRSVYDDLHRILQQWLTENIADPAPEKLIIHYVYGENQLNDTVMNLRGRLFQVFDQSGLAQMGEYDFKGNVKNSLKQLAVDYKNTIDWNVPDPAPLLETDLFPVSSLYDAVNKPVETDLADGSKLFPLYDQSGLFTQLNVFVKSQGSAIQFIENISYNAKTQREKILYGNNTVTGYTYDEKNYRLIRLLTTRNKGADILQDLNYTYDPVANVTQIRDDALQTIFFNNAKVDPGNKFEYDAIYRLLSAYGREYAGSDMASDQFDRDKMQNGGGGRLTLKGDMNAMQRYEESYQYDEAGNMLQMIHNAGSGVFQNKWTKIFSYNTSNNRLVKMSVGAASTNYGYDAHGNMLNLQQGSYGIGWNFSDQLQQVELGGGGTAYYVYDHSGQRVRKVIENGGLVKDRLYVGNYEVYREKQGGTLTLERETLHILDGQERIALVETRTQGMDAGLAFLIRYQYSNHLQTACLEIDGNPGNPAIISYEEYYPFGSTAYQAGRNQTDTPKRYRYTGKERDEESGLYYHGARYYIPWLARWTTVDPAGTSDGMNLYAYVSDNPVRLYDPGGTDGNDSEKNKPAKAVATPEAKPSYTYSFPYSYQSWGSQLGKDSGKAAGFLWDASKTSPEFKWLESNLLDPELSRLKTDFLKEWGDKSNRASMILGGSLFALPTVAALTLLSVNNPKLDIPIIGKTPARTLGFDALSLALGLASKGLLDDKIKLSLGYKEDDKTGKGTYSGEIELKGDKGSIKAGGSFGNEKSVKAELEYNVTSDVKVSPSAEYKKTDKGTNTSLSLSVDWTRKVGPVQIDLQIKGIYQAGPADQSSPFNPKFNADDPSKTITGAFQQPFPGSGGLILFTISPFHSKKEKTK
jgi:RHS repeat-associated protein